MIDVHIMENKYLRHRLIFFAIAIGVLSFLFFMVVADSAAHTPHDVIDCVALSPNYTIDKTIFVAMSDHLRLSTDRGASWKDLVNGLDNNSKFTSLAISPTFKVDRTIYLSSNGDGIYRSNDAGGSWIKVNKGLENLEISALAISPHPFDHTVLAAGYKKGLYLSTDAGEHWLQVIAQKKITALAFIPHTKGTQILAGDYAGRLHRSGDNGRTWHVIFQNSDWGAINCFAVSQGIESDKTFFVGTEKMGIFKTVDAGRFFLPVNRGLEGEMHIRSLAISPNFSTDKTIFATTWYEAVYSSTDGGNTWIQYQTGLTTDRQANSKKYRSPHFRDLKIAQTSRSDQTIFLGGFDGLFRSEAHGKTWTQMETMPVSLIMGLDLHTGTNNYLEVGITTYGGGAYTAHTNNRTWKINNTGLKNTRLSDIVFSPNYSADHSIFSASHGYLLKSTNKGDKWQRISLSIQNWKIRIFSLMDRLKIPTGLLRKIILSKYERSRPFATDIILSPNYLVDKTLFFGTRYHGIFKSTDSGEHNSVVWKAEGNTVDSLAISNEFEVDHTIFAGIRGRGVYRSEDGGISWKPSFIGNNDGGHSQNYILAISNDYSSDRTIFVATGKGLFKTTDGGKHWLSLISTHHGEDDHIITVAVSPNYQSDQTVLISVKGRGLFKSHDGGHTFNALAPGMIRSNHTFKWIKFSKAFALNKTIYAASYENLFHTEDGGLKWQMVKRPVRYENHRDAIDYEGDWKHYQSENFSATKISYSNSAHAKARLRFFGTGVSWIGSKSNDTGITRVYVDGDFMAEIDQYSTLPKTMIELYSIKNLQLGSHEIAIEATNKQNKSAIGNLISIDAFDISP
jgi:photosystem II stability/assembly factor-like uncharacterized protein